jgi:uncharacterized protein YllA (UPF0747 family)
MNEPVVRTDALGGSALSRAARAGELPEWFVPVPAGDPAWRAHADQVRESASPAWYDALRDAIAPMGAAARRLEAAVRGRGFVVTTGQQPGLFGGPLMTLVKAISARALADELQAALGVPVAPLFWAATDDADFDEAAVVSVALEGGAREIRLDERSAAGTPVARVPLDSDIDALFATLRESCGSAPHAGFLAATERAYREDATIGSAYVELLRQVLEPLEIAVFDISHPAATAAAAPVMRRAARGAERAAAAVRERNDAITSRGFTPQVDEVPGLSLVFENSKGIKRRLSLDEAAALPPSGLTNGSYLSSTVLLRPVLERALFPTLAYVAGPGELAYFAQVTAVAEALDLAKPLVVPRWSMTIIEPRVQRILDDLDLAVDSLADPHAVETRIARTRLPSAAADALRSLRADIAGDVDRLRQSTEGLLSADVLDGLQRNLEHRASRAERRLLAAVKRRETELMRRIGTARGSLYPHGVKQERKLAYIPFLARYGAPLLAQMLANAAAHARGIVRRSTEIARESIPVSR